jgi:hypothetical protein
MSCAGQSRDFVTFPRVRLSSTHGIELRPCASRWEKLVVDPQCGHLSMLEPALGPRRNHHIVPATSGPKAGRTWRVTQKGANGGRLHLETAAKL